jgi:hypothetical protein
MEAVARAGASRNATAFRQGRLVPCGARAFGAGRGCAKVLEADARTRVASLTATLEIPPAARQRETAPGPDRLRSGNTSDVTHSAPIRQFGRTNETPSWYA